MRKKQCWSLPISPERKMVMVLIIIDTHLVTHKCTGIARIMQIRHFYSFYLSKLIVFFWLLLNFLCQISRDVLMLTWREESQNESEMLKNSISYGICFRSDMKWTAVGGAAWRSKKKLCLAVDFCTWWETFQRLAFSSLSPPHTKLDHTVRHSVASQVSTFASPLHKAFLHPC